MKRFLAFAFLSFLSAWCLSSFISAANIKGSMQICKIFPDIPFAESMVRHLKKTSINEFVMQEDLDRIEVFVQRSAERISGEISSIEGVQYLNNLIQFSLKCGKVNILTPLSKLTKLEWVSLPCNQIINLEPLKKLTNLEWLDLNSNQISDLRPLKKLNKLKILNLTDNKIEKIRPLLELKNLTSLGIANNEIKDMALVSTVGGGVYVVTKEGKEYFWNP